MSMLVAPAAPAVLELRVEAGATAEILLDVSMPPDGSGEVRVGIDGVPASWYSLAVDRLEPPGRVLLVLHPPELEHGGEPGVYQARTVVVAENGERSVSPMRVHVLAPGLDGERPTRSRLIDFLPRHYQSDDFLTRFLQIFQVAFDHVEHTIDNTHYLLDPGVTPPQFLDWLANWLDLDLSTTTDVAGQRVLIERAVELYRWKGTRRGLRAELALRLNARALIVENFDGLRLGHDAAMGVNTHLGRRRDGCMSVTLGASGGDRAELLRRAEDLLERVKPAGSGYIVRCAPAARATQGEN